MLSVVVSSSRSTLPLHLDAGHGTQVEDKDGDETDGLDEGESNVFIRSEFCDTNIGVSYPTC